jgi:hypothetical protein
MREYPDRKTQGAMCVISAARVEENRTETESSRSSSKENLSYIQFEGYYV